MPIISKLAATDTMATSLTHIDRPLLTSLSNSGHIYPIMTTESSIAQETSSLQRLRQQMNTASQPLSAKHAYLNLYDRLFRHVSLALLAQGYQLTSKQPHQSLRRIAGQYLSDTDIQQMIAHRHLLKKTHYVHLCEKSVTTLTKLLFHYDHQDSQACQKLI